MCKEPANVASSVLLISIHTATAITTAAITVSQQAPQHLDTWLLVFDVALRRGKWLLAVKALNKGTAITQQHELAQEPALALRTVQVRTTSICISNFKYSTC
jgi:hypothetical protein